MTLPNRPFYLYIFYGHFWFLKLVVVWRVVVGVIQSLLYKTCTSTVYGGPQDPKYGTHQPNFRNRFGTKVLPKDCSLNEDDGSRYK